MTDTASISAFIDREARRFENAIANGNIAELGEMYAPDAALMEPHFPAIHGRQHIEEFWLGARQAGMRSVRVNITDVEVVGEIAIELGTYQLAVEPPGQPPVVDDGKYMLLWKLQPSGDWKIYRHMANTNAPALAAAG